MNRLLIRTASLLLPVTLLCGCFTAKQSEPPRTATELLLLSTASDNAMKDVNLTWLRGKKIFVEEKYFEGIDKGYAISLIRDHLSSAGALLMKTDDKADVIVEIRSGGLGMNTSATLFGIPTLTIPVPLSGPLQTPEIAFYKSDKADSIGKFALYAYVRETGEHIASQGPMSGYAHFYFYKIFGIKWKRTNIPELKKHPYPEGRMPNETPVDVKIPENKTPDAKAPPPASPPPPPKTEEKH